MSTHNRFGAGAAVTLIAALSLVHGCSDDATGPTDIDPAPVADAVEDVALSFGENEALASLNAVAVLFPGAIGASPIVTSSPTSDIQAPPLARALRTVTLQAAAVVHSDPAPHLFSTIPAEALGTTFEYEPGEGYVPSDRPGAPANGVRFILYAINPVTHEPVVETEIGHVDLLDTSTSSANRLRIVVVSDGETFIDYEMGCSIGASSASLSGSGFITDGVTQANLDLSLTLTVTEGSEGGTDITSQFDFDVQVPSENLTFAFDATESISSGAGSFSLDATFSVTHGSNTIGFTISLTEAAVDGQVAINGGVVAVISGTPQAPVITDSGGGELEPEEIENLERLFAGAQEVIEPLILLLTAAAGVCF